MKDKKINVAKEKDLGILKAVIREKNSYIASLIKDCKESHKKIEDIEGIIFKTSIVYESIINCEQKLGIICPIEEIIQEVNLLSKDNKITISKKQTIEILDVLLRKGIVFYPMKGYVERFSTYKENQKEINKVFIGGK